MAFKGLSGSQALFSPTNQPFNLFFLVSLMVSFKEMIIFVPITKTRKQ